MKISPIFFNKANIYKTDFKSNKIAKKHDFEIKTYTPEQKSKAAKLQLESTSILSRANTIKKIARKKYEEAQEIYWYWLQKRPEMIIEKGTVKEYSLNYGELSTYYESNADNFERTIKFTYNKP